MEELTANWLFVGERTFQRSEIYGSDWSKALVELTNNFEGSSESFKIAAAPFGGPIVLLKNQKAHILRASGSLVSSWQWKNGKVVEIGWSINEDVVFVTDDGSVLVYNTFGEFLKVFSMGQEAKDLKILSAKVFRGHDATGVAVLTSAKRFFVVNNILEPRVRKMADCELRQTDSCPWAVLADTRQAKIVVASGAKVFVVSQTDVNLLPMGQGQGDVGDKDEVVSIVTNYDFERIAVLFLNGTLWMGSVDGKLTTFPLQILPNDIAWCRDDALVLITKASFQCRVISIQGESAETFVPDFICSVQELDGVRMMTCSSQDIVQEVPKSLLDTFDLRVADESPSANLRYASEEFGSRNHRANDYLHQAKGQLELGVGQCIASAGHVVCPLLQKELLRAAQLGKSFLQQGSSSALAESFNKMCSTLRILNCLRDTQIGIPLTIEQYDFLGSKVIIDRLLSRRMYKVALMFSEVLNIPHKEGKTRILSHWACYKVSVANDSNDLATAKSISQRLGQHPQLSYSDIAAKAMDCGKKELAIKLLEHEARPAKQVPLLMQLGQDSQALVRALTSGDRDLAFSVLLHLRNELPSSEFYFIVRKFPLGKVLFERYCREYNPETLSDWFVQEDNFAALANESFQHAFETNRFESRMSYLRHAKDNWTKSKDDTMVVLADESLKLLELQSKLGHELPGTDFLGLCANDTMSELLAQDQLKWAEKVKTELKVSERRFAWLRARAMIRQQQWPELKKFLKQKKQPLSVSNVVHMVKEMVGESEAKAFLTEDLMNNQREKIDLYTEFGMFLEAANAAFIAKSMDSLNAIEAMCGHREEALRAISSFKAKLMNK